MLAIAIIGISEATVVVKKLSPGPDHVGHSVVVGHQFVLSSAGIANIMWI